MLSKGSAKAQIEIDESARIELREKDEKVQTLEQSLQEANRKITVL